MLRQQLTQFAHGARYIQEIADTSLTRSPYGDGWDLFLLGHCTALSRPKSDGRYWAAHNDPTVMPGSKYIWRTEPPHGGPDTSPVELQGNFSRIIYQPDFSRCAYAYALSLQGAQKLLYHFSIEPRTDIFDMMLSDFCTDPDIDGRCVTVFPNLFDEYLPAGSSMKDSDRRDYALSQFKDRVIWREHGAANNIVFPVKTGLRTQVESRTNWDSQWPNDTLRAAINPATDRLPIGQGYLLTGDQFSGINQDIESEEGDEYEQDEEFGPDRKYEGGEETGEVGKSKKSQELQETE